MCLASAWCLAFCIISGVVPVLAVSQSVDPRVLTPFLISSRSASSPSSLLLSVVLEPPAPHQPRTQHASLLNLCRPPCEFDNSNWKAAWRSLSVICARQSHAHDVVVHSTLDFTKNHSKSLTSFLPHVRKNLL